MYVCMYVCMYVKIRRTGALWLTSMTSSLSFKIDLFSLYISFSQYRQRDATRGNRFFKNSFSARAQLSITKEGCSQASLFQFIVRVSLSEIPRNPTTIVPIHICFYCHCFCYWSYSIVAWTDSALLSWLNYRIQGHSFPYHWIITKATKSVLCNKRFWLICMRWPSMTLNSLVAPLTFWCPDFTFSSNLSK